MLNVTDMKHKQGKYKFVEIMLENRTQLGRQHQNESYRKIVGEEARGGRDH
jgi:hypothetical protein